MHLSTLDLVAGLVTGAAASVLGGYLGGTALAGKTIGRDLAGFLGILYGPPAGAVGVVVATVIVALLVKTA
jgi:hypothetical protein